MKSSLLKLWIFISVFCILMLGTKVEAATFGLKANKSEVTVGESFSVIISGIYGKVTISGTNVQVSPSGSQFVDGSLTITGTTKAEGTAKVTVTAHEAATTGANPQEVSETKCVSVKVKAKETEKTQTPTQQTTTQKTQQQTSNNKTTTKKTENKKTQVVETQEKEEATPELGIHALKIIGIKENGEEVQVNLDKEFTIKMLDYSCNVADDIKTLRIEKEAYEYNDFVQISGLEEPLKEGENIVTLKVSKDGKEIVYQIKIEKEAKKEEVMQEEVKTTSANVEEQTNKSILMVSISLGWFITLEIVIMAVGAGIAVVVMIYLKQSNINKENIEANQNNKGSGRRVNGRRKN